MRYELSDYEWTAIKPMLPNKPRGVRRLNDRRVLNGIFWVLRSGAPALVAGIHVLLFFEATKTWMAETSPAMTVETSSDHCAGVYFPSFTVRMMRERSSRP